MKYKIVVEKENESLYFAYCPVMPGIRASGDTANQSLSNIQQEILCYLHDTSAEFEIVFEGHEESGSADTLHGAV